MPQTILNNGEEKMKKVIEAFQKELQTVKTGRANPAILNRVKVSYYGSEMPLNQLASISVPEATILMIKPYDKSLLKDIEKAILAADLNLTPQSDGTVVRIIFPPLTENTRKDLVKNVKTQGENMKVGIRNARRDINDELKSYEKEGLISEDELKDYIDQSQKLTDKYILEIDSLVKEKEKNIMEI